MKVQMGMPGPQNSREARIAERALRMTSGPRHPDYTGQSTRDRPAAAGRAPRQLEDTESLSGSLPVLTHG
jgi:hypothetical protein